MIALFSSAISVFGTEACLHKVYLGKLTIHNVLPLPIKYLLKCHTVKWFYSILERDSMWHSLLIYINFHLAKLFIMDKVLYLAVSKL